MSPKDGHVQVPSQMHPHQLSPWQVLVQGKLPGEQDRIGGSVPSRRHIVVFVEWLSRSPALNSQSVGDRYIVKVCRTSPQSRRSGWCHGKKEVELIREKLVE